MVPAAGSRGTGRTGRDVAAPRHGVGRTTYLAAQLAGNGGDYEDGTTRYFTCQTCHMRPAVGKG
jgi:hypothetical protein